MTFEVARLAFVVAVGLLLLAACVVSDEPYVEGRKLFKSHNEAVAFSRYLIDHRGERTTLVTGSLSPIDGRSYAMVSVPTSDDTDPPNGTLRFSSLGGGFWLVMLEPPEGGGVFTYTITYLNRDEDLLYDWGLSNHFNLSRDLKQHKAVELYQECADRYFGKGRDFESGMSFKSSWMLRAYANECVSYIKENSLKPAYVYQLSRMR